MPSPERFFDFLEGRWTGRSFVPAADGRLVDEGPLRLDVQRVLDRLVFIEMYEGPYRGRHIQGLGLRAFNPATGNWDHTWTDTSAPGGFLVWRGRPEGDQISLHGGWEEDGREVRSRLTWSRIRENTAPWEIHRSTDGQRTWTLHWAIEFTKVG
jgi:hypothetical protein